jgi:4-hydroxybenzoyl-CoA reductase subunit beta
MQLESFEYLRPATVEECLAARVRAGAGGTWFAGGTDLLVSMKQGLERPDVLISLRGVPALREHQWTQSGDLRIGAACTLTSLVADPRLGREFPALARAIRGVGSRHVRNAATLGGNLCLPTRCWYTNQSEDWRDCRTPCFKTEGGLCHVIQTSSRCHAINSSDTAPALMALGAVLDVTGPGGQRQMSVADLYRDDGVEFLTLAPGDLLTHITVPASGLRSTFIKVAQRDGLDYAAANIAVALALNAGRVTRARLVVGSVGSRPLELGAAAHCLEGQPLTSTTAEAAAAAAREDLGQVSNLFSPSGYKRRLVKALVRRALAELAVPEVDR